MFKFIEKMTEWMLKKEEEMANNCEISEDEIEKEIEKIVAKREDLKKRCQEQDEELGHIIDKLHWIKAEAQKCQK